jgi:hypothetical protein
MIIQTTKTLRPRDPHDYYPTPAPVITAALLPFQTFLPAAVLDIGAGDGVWGQEARTLWPGAHITGAELRPIPAHPAYNYWHTGDFRALPDSWFDLVIGNPPYRIAEDAVRWAVTHSLPAGGAVVMLLRLAFLEGQARARGLWREYPPTRVRVLARRPSFTGNGKTDATAYAIFEWHAKRAATRLEWLDWGTE